MAAPSLRRRLVTRRTPAGHARRIVTARATKQLTAFLAAQARLNRHWLRTSMPAGPRPRDVIDQLSIERGREVEFQRRSVSRLSRDLPDALAMPARSRRAQAARAREVRRILDTERRYAKLHTRELARRSLASVTRARLRTESPEGAFWQLGHAKQHTGGCLIMAGHFWPWVVLDRVHPPRHAGCTSSLHSKAEAVARGWMAEGDVPSDADAIHRAGTVMMEGERDALLRELAVRDRLVELGADREALAEIPWMGVLSEAFTADLHPRDWRGRFRRVGEVAAAMADRSIAWRVRADGSMPADAPSRQEITQNFTKHLRGTLSQDRGAIGMVAEAQKQNAGNAAYQRIVRSLEPDHVIVTKPRPERTHSLMYSGHGIPHRIAGTTPIPEDAVRTIGLEASKAPKDHPASSAAYGLAAVLRHEYGHSIDDLLPRDVRRRILDAIPDPSKDLTYYAGTGDQEVIPELLALITHPNYRRSDWPQTVQEAERRLMAALGHELREEATGGTTEAVRDAA